MNDAESVLQVRISEPDADELRIDELVRSLRRELLDAGGDQVTQPTGGPAPAGSRGFDALTVGTLLVSITSSALTLSQAVETVRGWLRGASKECSIVLEVGGRSVTLNGGTARQQRHLVAEALVALQHEPEPKDA